MWNWAVNLKCPHETFDIQSNEKRKFYVQQTADATENWPMKICSKYSNTMEEIPLTLFKSETMEESAIWEHDWVKSTTEMLELIVTKQNLSIFVEFQSIFVIKFCVFTFFVVFGSFSVLFFQFNFNFKKFCFISIQNFWVLLFTSYLITICNFRRKSPFFTT